MLCAVGVLLAAQCGIASVPGAPVAVRPVGRQAFERGEAGAALKLQVVGSDAVFSVPVETRLKPGMYDVPAPIAGRLPSGEDVVATNSVQVRIGPTFADRMPAVLWGMGAGAVGTVKDVRDFGFTHVFIDGKSLSFSAPATSQSAAQRIIDRYDGALSEGMRMMRAVNVQYPVEGEARKRFYRMLRGGEEPTDPREIRQPEVSNPELLEYGRRTVAADNEAVGYHPAFAGVNVSSEQRDLSFPSFNTEHLRYKAETGRDVPPEVRGRKADFNLAQARFPDGVVPTDDPLYAYYSWFWGGGDGWPGYTGGIAAEYRKGAGRYGDGSELQRRRPFFSFWDPSVRCPPKWGSGGDVDVVSHWVYANPEPMNVAGIAEEVLAMAAGRPGQTPMIMTQLICYRSRIAPTNVVVSPKPGWLIRRPKADFPTIPADSLQEAVWSMLAKPVKGIMFHGWKTIFDSGQERGYTYTSPETAARMKTLLHDTVAPLGPMLKGLGRDEPEVAVLESFETAAFGGPASWGWTAPAITFLQRARLDPRVAFEETIMRDGFGGAKILYAPQCRLLSAPVVERIREFQRAGGILVADDELLPALKADVTVPVVKYGKPPKSDHTEDVDADTETRVNVIARRFTESVKAGMIANADSLRTTLAERYSYAPKADSSSPEIVVYSRAWRGTTYVFAVNDRRTFGDYVGQWGLTMEKGLHFSGSVTLADPGRKVGAVYELSRGVEVPFTRRADGRVDVPISYDTNDGRLLMFLESKIADVKVDCSMSNDCITVTMTVYDDARRPVAARLPVEIRIFDAAGTELDGAGFACAEGGVCTMTVPTNLNDAPGGYRVVCRDRASGIVREKLLHQPQPKEKTKWIKRSTLCGASCARTLRCCSVARHTRRSIPMRGRRGRRPPRHTTGT